MNLLHRDLDLPENLWLIGAKNRHGRCGETSTLAMYDRSTLASFIAPARTRPHLTPSTPS